MGSFGQWNTPDLCKKTAKQPCWVAGLVCAPLPHKAAEGSPSSASGLMFTERHQQSCISTLAPHKRTHSFTQGYETVPHSHSSWSSPSKEVNGSQDPGSSDAYEVQVSFYKLFGNSSPRGQADLLWPETASVLCSQMTFNLAEQHLWKRVEWRGKWMDVGSGTGISALFLIAPISHSLCSLTPWMCTVRLRSSPKGDRRACPCKLGLQHNRAPLFALTTRERISDSVVFWGT